MDVEIGQQRPYKDFVTARRDVPDLPVCEFLAIILAGLYLLKVPGPLLSCFGDCSEYSVGAVATIVAELVFVASDQRQAWFRHVVATELAAG